MRAPKFEKKAVFEHLAESIEAQIKKEGWSGLLPSGRQLAEAHKVSLPTVQKAIALLLDRKILVSRGGRRRPAVMQGVASGGMKPSPCEVLVLSAAPLGTYDASIALGVIQLGESLKSAGDGFRFVDLSTTSGDARRAAAHAEMVRSRPTHCILMHPDRYLYKGVSRHKVRMASMFSTLRTRSLTSLGVKYGYLVEIAVEHLTALGHRRFFMPFLGRKKKLRASMAAIRDVARERNVEIKVKLSAEDCSMENMSRALDEGLARGATAVLFPQWTDFMPAIGYFARKGLEFPRDLSVVALVATPAASCFIPPLAGCISAPESIAQQAEIWVRSDDVSDEVYKSVYARTWLAGGSIGPAPVR